MNLEQKNNYLKIEDDAYAWRYVSFQKLWDIISNNEIYFARLDMFDDPLEGMSSELRIKLELTNNKRDLNVPQDFAPLLNSIKILKTDIDGWQHGTFTSCWFLTEIINSATLIQNHVESLAMWNIYADKNSFCLKIKFDRLKSIIESAPLDEEIDKVIYGKIHYLTAWEDRVRHKTETIYPSLIKHKTFQFENEVRFQLLRTKIKDKERVGIRLKPELSLKDFLTDMEIYCHPDMDEAVYKTFYDKIKSIGFNLTPSHLLTRKVVNQLIVMDTK